MQQMKSFFENLTESDNAEFQKNESTWWNGHAFLPIFNYNLKYKFLSGKVEINYEFRQSEFSKPSMIDVGTFGDRHLYQLKCEIETEKTYPNFSISERGILAKLFWQKSDSLYKVKCKDEKLKKVLKQNGNLKKIFIIIENSSEFSPLITANMKNGNYELNIMYNTQQKNEETLYLTNNFCKNLIEYCDK
jgi:hypothetical protein